MMIYGIGIDVVELDRIERAIERQGEAFLAKLFTGTEREYCQRQRRPGLHYAARFAAKEAVSKALGTGIGGKVGWLEVEVLRSESGAPRVEFHGAARDFLVSKGISEVQVSLSHARDYAAANAVAICGAV